MHLTLLLLSGLGFTSLVCAAPKQKWELVPVRPAPLPPLGPFVPCDLNDDECTCTRNVAGGFEYYCGYVDPDWISGASKRDAAYDEAEPAMLETRQLEESSPADKISDRDFSVAQPDRNLQLPKRDEIQRRVRYPLMSALATIGFGKVKAGVTRVIVNRFPKDSPANWVNGLKGFLPVATTINGVKFVKGALWEIRYDFSWYKTNGEMPASGILGPHVNMRIQDGVNSQTFAWYFKEDSIFYKPVAQMGSTYFDQVVKVLTDLAQYVGSRRAFEAGEDVAAEKIAEKWWSAFEAFSLVPELRDELKMA